MSKCLDGHIVFFDYRVQGVLVTIKLCILVPLWLALLKECNEDCVYNKGIQHHWWRLLQEQPQRDLFDSESSAQRCAALVQAALVGAYVTDLQLCFSDCSSKNCLLIWVWMIPSNNLMKLGFAIWRSFIECIIRSFDLNLNILFLVETKAGFFFYHKKRTSTRGHNLVASMNQLHQFVMLHFGQFCSHTRLSSFCIFF